jgi:flagellar hook-length control protein FliK
MLELAGEEDALALVTNEDLLTSINSVTDIALNALDELNEEFGITPEEINSIIESIKENDPEIAAGMQAGPADAGDDDRVEEEPLDDKGIRVEVRRDEAPEKPEIREASTENVTMQKKVSQMMDERKQEGQMQDSMPGQSFIENLQGNETAAVAGAGQGPEPYVDARSIMDQVTDQIKVNISEETTEMEIRLHPASLGTVNLQIASNGGVVTANILVQNEAVKSVIESQLVQLLETFEEQGQKVEAIEVAVAGYDLDRSLNQNNERGGEGGQERRNEGIGRTTRRRLNLNELTQEDLEELTEEEQLAAEMMEANGTSVDYKA